MGLALEKVEFVGAAVPVGVLLVVVEYDVVVVLADIPRCPVRVKASFLDVAGDGLAGPAVLTLLLVAVDRGPRFTAGVGFELFADKILVFLVDKVSSAFLLSPAVTAVVTVVEDRMLLLVAVFSLAPMAAATARAVAMVDEGEAVEEIFVGCLSFEIY
jgi:hypothetical protein